MARQIALSDPRRAPEFRPYHPRPAQSRARVVAAAKITRREALRPRLYLGDSLRQE